MSFPDRIQRRRTKGWRIPKGAVYVGRPTKFGNPYRTAPNGCHCHTCLVVAYEQEVMERGRAEALLEIRGKDLVCWCALDRKCHADVLRVAANWSEAPESWKQIFANLRALGEAVDALAASANCDTERSDG